MAEKKRSPGISEPTRRAMFKVMANGGVLEEEAALSSVEVREDSTGTLRVCVKTYAKETKVAGQKTVAALKDVKKMLASLQPKPPKPSKEKKG